MNFLAKSSQRLIKPSSFYAPVGFYSTQRKDPVLVAESVLSKLPGDSLAAKASSALITGSVAAWLISNEIYILDGEVFEMACFFGAYAIWYINGKNSAIEYFNDRKSTMKKILEDARKEHMEVVKEKINHISKVDELVDVTSHLYGMAKVSKETNYKEMAQMEAKIYELQQKVAFTSEIKSTLDAWVRHETNIRDQEQKRLVAQIIDKVKAQLQDPKVQQSILTQSIADVERITKSK